jgi:predicted transcriptional regulator
MSKTHPGQSSPAFRNMIRVICIPVGCNRLFRQLRLRECELRSKNCVSCKDFWDCLHVVFAINSRLRTAEAISRRASINESKVRKLLQCLKANEYVDYEKQYEITCARLYGLTKKGVDFWIPRIEEALSVGEYFKNLRQQTS